MSDKSIKELNTVPLAPHLTSGETVRGMMWTTVAALMPAIIYSSCIFGFKTFCAYIISTACAVATEALFRVIMKRSIKKPDGSAVITGLLIVMLLPPESPLWLPAAGSIFAVIIAKQLFGGLGLNLFNPAVAGRTFLLLVFPSYLRTGWNISSSGIDAANLTWYAVLPQQGLDAISGVFYSIGTPGSSGLILDYSSSFAGIYDFYIHRGVLKALFIGNFGGNAGEISVLFIIAGGLFLIWRKIISWHTPVCFVGSLALISYLFYYCKGVSYPGFITLVHVMSGSVILCAVFMATDPVTSPLTFPGMVIFGICCGLITFAVRVLGGFPEGATEAVLVMNAAVPLIDRITRPSVFGLPRTVK